MGEVKVGDRIRLIKMPDDPAPIEPGAEGVVEYVEHIDWHRTILRQIHVKWDNGRTLSLAVPPDVFVIVE